jgi:hypothetical protein
MDPVGPICVAVFANVLRDICKELDCFGHLPLQCEEPESSKSSGGSKRLSGRASKGEPHAEEEDSPTRGLGSSSGADDLFKLTSKNKKYNTCGTGKYFKKNSSHRLTKLVSMSTSSESSDEVDCKETKCATSFIKIESPKFCINDTPTFCNEDGADPPCFEKELVHIGKRPTI